jgi:hypothetical protein
MYPRPTRIILHSEFTRPHPTRFQYKDRIHVPTSNMKSSKLTHLRPCNNKVQSKKIMIPVQRTGIYLFVQTNSSTPISQVLILNWACFVLYLKYYFFIFYLSMNQAMLMPTPKYYKKIRLRIAMGNRYCNDFQVTNLILINGFSIIFN